MKIINNKIIRNLAVLKSYGFNNIKNYFNQTSLDNAVIVASMGRCGSTLLVNNLAKGYRRQKSRLDIVRLDDHINPDYHTTNESIERGFDGEEAEKLGGQYLNGYVYKSHDIAPDWLPEHVKVIYLFGDPVDIVFSAKQLDEINLTGVDSNFTSLDLHIRNLRGNYKDKGFLFEKDVLRLEKNFDSWFRKQSFPVLALRYETMWEHQDAIRDFTGFLDFRLPPYKERKKLIDNFQLSEVASVKKTYKDLSGKIKASDDITLFN